MKKSNKKLGLKKVSLRKLNTDVNGGATRHCDGVGAGPGDDTGSETCSDTITLQTAGYCAYP